MNHPLIALQELTKKYSAEYCLGPLNLEFQPGETIALLGPNGAGKTTLFQLLTGNLDASSGKALYENSPIKPQNFQIKKNFGYLPQDLGLPPWVNAQELLHYAASLYKIPSPKQRIDKLYELWEIDHFKNRPLAACSHGMQKRVGLALATLHNPAMLILDEPFSGLDLFHIRSLENMVKERKAAQLTTILSTHNIPYAARLCDYPLIIKAGKIHSLPAWETGSWEERITLAEQQFFSHEGQTT